MAAVGHVAEKDHEIPFLSHTAFDNFEVIQKLLADVIPLSSRIRRPEVKIAEQQYVEFGSQRFLALVLGLSCATMPSILTADMKGLIFTFLEYCLCRNTHCINAVDATSEIGGQFVADCLQRRRMPLPLQEMRQNPSKMKRSSLPRESRNALTRRFR